MTPGQPRPPRSKFKYVLLLALLVAAVAFLIGPNGLVAVLARRHQEHRLQSQIRLLHREIAERTDRRDWLTNTDSATAYARKLLGAPADSGSTGH